MIDLRKHEAFGPLEEPSRAALNALSLSTHDAVPVANATERAQLVADLTAAGFGPSPARPLRVYREDGPTVGRVEYTTDGTTWVTEGAGTGASVTVGNGQSVGAGTESRLGLGFPAVKISPGWTSGGTSITVPEACMLTFTLRIVAEGVISGRFFGRVDLGTDTYRNGSANERYVMVTGRVAVAAGTSVQVYVYHAHSTVRTFNGSLDLVADPLPQGW